MTDGTARAWGWVAHLRAGGSTPWAAWAAPAEPMGRFLPGAEQLELLRRTNLVERPAPDLAGRLLRTDPPRHSRSGLPLVDGPPVPAHGPRPVDPGRLGDQELLRLVAVALAGDLASASPPPARRSWPRPWRVRHRLVGDPEHVAGLRRQLDARGWVEGGVGPVVVIATDTGRMLLDVWTAQALRHGTGPWQKWLARVTGGDGLPRAADPPRLVREHQHLPTTRRLHVVTEPALAPRLVGVRRRLPPPPLLSASAVDLGRRVAGELRPLAVPARRERLVTGVLRPALADAPGLPLVVPAGHRDWVREQAERVEHRLRRARYPVHGDPALVLPVDRAGVERPDPSETLALAIRMLLSGELRRSAEEQAKEEP